MCNDQLQRLEYDLIKSQLQNQRLAVSIVCNNQQQEPKDQPALALLLNSGQLQFSTVLCVIQLYVSASLSRRGAPAYIQYVEPMSRM